MAVKPECLGSPNRDSGEYSTVNQLLDSLLQQGIINKEEMDSARIKPRADRARDVIDVVRNKGEEASSSLIDGLRELDPYLSETLHLS
uniref:CARD domain-containing protein n=1 Tax=Haplochromis burtoni TaxID=8153 RepID=A0A3Q2VBU1_HAPBU